MKMVEYERDIYSLHNGIEKLNSKLIENCESQQENDKNAKILNLLYKKRIIDKNGD